MGRSEPVELATRSFEEQGQATSFFKAKLNRYRPGECANDEDGLDLANLLERHTEYVAKVSCGVGHFEVMLTKHGTLCFRIVGTVAAARTSRIRIASRNARPPESRR